VATASQRDPAHGLELADGHTIGCRAETVTYLPIPAEANVNHAGLLTVDIPPGVRRGEQYTVLVRQVTSAQAYRRPGPEPGVHAAAAAEGGGGLIRWRRVFGAFQIAIPVHTKAILLPGEERQLSILRWIQDGIDPRSRWHAVFTRYLGQLAGRVDGLGGTSGDVHPSPTGDWHRHRPGKPDRHATGKVCAVVYDRYGDFDGFLLDTPHGERRYLSREKDLAALIERAWSRRLRITIVSDSGEPGKPREVILRGPSASSTCDLC
jgi:hypothetical protein